MNNFIILLEDEITNKPSNVQYCISGINCNIIHSIWFLKGFPLADPLSLLAYDIKSHLSPENIEVDKPLPNFLFS